MATNLLRNLHTLEAFHRLELIEAFTELTENGFMVGVQMDVTNSKEIVMESILPVVGHDGTLMVYDTPTEPKLIFTISASQWLYFYEADVSGGATSTPKPWD